MHCDWIGTNHPDPAGKFAYFRLDAELAEGMTSVFRHPDGCEIPLHGDVQSIQ